MIHKTISVSFEKDAMMSIYHQSLGSIHPISTSELPPGKVQGIIFFFLASFWNDSQTK